ncbi:MAG: outer membrane lipoprotein chaperone LolA [Gammaproteobacteria bacterium]|nr:outer membrane lipoprotein chaperone LolA [Gammaproteobacteria bacterium]
MKTFFLFLSIAASGVALAGNAVDDRGELLVNDFLTKVITLDARFEQSLIDAEGEVVERTSGTLEIERPTRFRWSYTEPYEQWLIADGLNIWSYDLDLEQVTVKPQAEALANTPALLLGGSENALGQFDFGGTTVESVTTWVRLEPKDKNSGFERVELGFIDDQLQRMVFFDNLGQTTLVALHDVTVNEPIDSERFDFIVPEDVDLVGTAAALDP